MNRIIWIGAVLVFLSIAGCGSSAKPYLLNVCLVTDNTLGSMGDPVSIDHEGQEVIFCCKMCIKKFKANPEKYLQKLHDFEKNPMKIDQADSMQKKEHEEGHEHHNQ